jgi:hypothetical protein
MILAASRKKAMCFSLNSNAESIYEAIQELFEDLGGITLELLIDNPKALVLENNPANEEEIHYNPQALLLAAHLGTELNACNCYWPRTKGKIEKPYQYIEEQFIKGNRFETMEELNIHGKNFINEWNKAMHSTTKRIPNEYFENEEIKSLLPLPIKRFHIKPFTKRIISNDSFIHINANKYSVPIKYATQTLFYHIVYGYRIDIYDQHENFIYSTEVLEGRHRINKHEEHYKAIAPKVNKSIPQIRRDFTKTFAHGDEYLQVASYLYQQPTYHARKILELTDLYDPEDLDKIIVYAIEHSMIDINSFKKLLKDKYYEIIVDKHEFIENQTKNEENGLTRSCDYYETQQEVTTV